MPGRGVGNSASFTTGADRSSDRGSSQPRSKRKHENDATTNHINEQQQPQQVKRRRYRPPVHPSTLPRFLDATGAVTAGTFAARRLPEMKSLWRSFVHSQHEHENAESSDQATVQVFDDSWNYRSGGRKTSDRHLRRRTNSHNPRRRHRFPAGLGKEETVESTDTTRGTCNDSRPKKPKCRRARRKPALLREAHRGWQRQSSGATSLASADNSHRSTTHWLETHLWHAKRFHMSPSLFGWNVPLVHNGRGTTAALRLAREKCTVQDATWSIDGGATILTSSSVSDLISALGRLCGPQAAFLDDRMVLTGNRWGEGLVHNLDAFPLGVIGPARFLFFRNGQQICVAVFVHPCIRTDVDAVLQSAADISGDSGVTVGRFNIGNRNGSGIALLQIRGNKATEAIQMALRPATLSSLDESAKHINLEQLSKSPITHQSIPHGIVAPVELNLSMQRKEANQDSDSVVRNTAEAETSTDATEDIKSYVQAFSEKVEDILVEDIVPASLFNGDGTFAMLISHRPDQTNVQLNHNAATCGWDILCSPNIVNDVFLCLNHRGGACAIGLAEDASFALEAEPPIPIFPRDYPDTNAGQSYWAGNNAEWNVVRCCLEHGARGGRFKTDLKRVIKLALAKKHNSSKYFPSLEWNSITSPVSEEGGEGHNNEEEGHSSVAVVRGAFGVPFVDALSASGHFITTMPPIDSAKMRRPRRPVRPPHKAIQSSPLTEEDAEKHENMCQMLFSSLSLPALIRCNISVEGKGALEPRARVLEHGVNENSEKITLGFVVAGAFSQGRGLFHGTAFVGAARLLQSLMTENPSRNIVAVSDCQNGGRKVALRVLVKNAADGTVPRSAFLTLML